ncbi:hypothetical protein GTGU_04746 [Trabulsiella guamensis ATCC 49490]|uniref:Uncharacterized protein n=1 Tax=Trabulsiella guamensis ATCC 49490 TaxID=1005994 RepID=A0A084Z6H9_9ENTR|nr:hypothetical protein [Trabulsiella guamensis]KFB93073.1 hypothetical protein GTGU_04746 [Trabulsiella guamensis ATCC 49490]
MKFINTLILGFIVVVTGKFLYEKENQPSVNERLISQFDKYDIIKRNSWKKDNIVDGVQVYSIRKDYTLFQSLWHLGKDKANVMVLTEGKEVKIDAAFALSQCNQLAIVVTDDDTPTIRDAVFSVFQNALAAGKDEEGVLRASGDVGGKPYSIFVRTIGSVLTFSCSIETV